MGTLKRSFVAPYRTVAFYSTPRLDIPVRRGTGLPNPSRETKLPGANGDREIFIFPVQLTTSRIGNLTRLIITLAICDDLTLHLYTSVRHFSKTLNLDITVHYNNILELDTTVRTLQEYTTVRDFS